MLPAIIVGGAVLFAIARPPARRMREGRAPHGGGLVGLAFAVAFCMAMPCVMGQWPLAVRSGWHVLFWVSAGAGLLALALGRTSLKVQAPAWPVAAVVTAVAIGLRRATHSNGWATSQAVLWITLTTVLLGTAPLALYVVQARRGAPAAAWGLAATAAIGMLATGFLGKSAMMAQLAITPAAMTAVVALVLTYWRGIMLPLSAWAVLTLLTQGMVIVTLEPYYAALPLIDGLPLLAAPLAVLAALWAGPDRPYAAAAGAVVAVIACCTPAVAHIIDTMFRYREAGYL